MPYRGGKPDDRAAPEETGLVADVVRQFTDPFAFYRELVQNAIDAGTKTIRVHLLLEGASSETGATIARVSIEDDGEGMARDVLETKLVVLFRSTKTAGDGKIGKFGIGFVSVLAIEPECVTVDTARDGHAYMLTLYPDHSYEIFDRGEQAHTGTTVTLRVPVEGPKGFRDFVDQSERALRRFCEHVAVPIHFSAHEGTLGELIERRIDTPFAIEALASVVRIHETGRVAVGLWHEPGLVRFYNRGLLLHETAEPLLGGLAAKLEDERLEHTLSRDDVRRDRAYEELLLRARAAARVELPRAIGHRLADVVHDDRRLREILEAAEGLSLDLAAATVRVPELVGEQLRSVALSELTFAFTGASPLYYAQQPTALTAAAPSSGVRVAMLGAIVHSEPALSLLSRVSGAPCFDVHRVFTHVEPIEPSGSDAVLLDECQALFDAVLRRPSGSWLGRFVGARQGFLALTAAASGDDIERVVPVDRGGTDPFRRFGRPHLVLDVDHEIVRAARQRAESDAFVAASLLVRAVLLTYGKLNERVDERLTTLVLERQLRAL